MGKLERQAQEINLEEFIGVKGYKAKGKRLASSTPKKIINLEPLPEPEPEPEPEIEETTGDQTQASKPNIVVDLEDEDPQMRLL